MAIYGNLRVRWFISVFVDDNQLIIHVVRKLKSFYLHLFVWQWLLERHDDKIETAKQNFSLRLLETMFSIIYYMDAVYLKYKC